MKRVLLLKLLLIVLLLLVFLPAASCMPIETSSRIQLGEDSAVLPKKESFKLVEYEFRGPDGTTRNFRVHGSDADPAAALNAQISRDVETAKVLQGLIEKIPSVK